MKLKSLVLTLVVAIAFSSCESNLDLEEKELQTISESEESEEDDEESDEVVVFNSTTSYSLLNTCKSDKNDDVHCKYIDEIIKATEVNNVVYATKKKRPKICPTLVGSTCDPGNDDFFLHIHAAGPEYVMAAVYCSGELCGMTHPELGGSVSYDETTQLAQLNFGIPTGELLVEGAVLVVQTVVEIDGELVETMIETEL